MQYSVRGEAASPALFDRPSRLEGTADQTEMEWSEMISRKMKLASATIGASAVVAMGTLTAVLSDDSNSATLVSDPGTEMTLGETSTLEKAATEIPTSVAVPEVTAEVPDGFGP
jgi:hypothetical protein